MEGIKKRQKIKLKQFGFLSFTHSLRRSDNGRQKCELLMKQWTMGLGLVASVCMKFSSSRVVNTTKRKYCRFPLNRVHVTKWNNSFKSVLSIPLLRPSKRQQQWPSRQCGEMLMKINFPNEHSMCIVFTQMSPWIMTQYVCVCVSDCACFWSLQRPPACQTSLFTILHCRLDYLCLNISVLASVGRWEKDVCFVLEIKTAQCSLRWKVNGNNTADITRRINKHKFTDNEVNAGKYLIIKFVFLFKHSKICKAWQMTNSKASAPPSPIPSSDF